MTAEISQISSERVLAEHAAEIRRLGQRVIADIIEIGRHLTEAKTIVGHGHFGHWITEEFGWSATTALNFMRVYELSRSNPQHVADLRLPMRSLYALAAPSTPEKARDEIIERATAGEQVSGAEVKETIARVKEKDGSAESANPESIADGTAGPADRPAEPADDAAASASERQAFYAATEPVADADHTGGAEHAAGRDGNASDAPAPTTEPADPTPLAPIETAPAPNPAATAAAAVNALEAQAKPETKPIDPLEAAWHAAAKIADGGDDTLADMKVQRERLTALFKQHCRWAWVAGLGAVSATQALIEAFHINKKTLAVCLQDEAEKEERKQARAERKAKRKANKVEAAQ